ncbi:MAG: protein-export chaperone SecB [Lysobacterales bacterium]
MSSLVADGGFPPLTLQPVNFDQLYAQRMQQMMQEQQPADVEEGETVAAEFSQPD